MCDERDKIEKMNKYLSNFSVEELRELLNKVDLFPQNTILNENKTHLKNV